MPDEDFNIRTLEFRLGSLHEDVREMKGNMSKLADAVTKFALIEERQIHTNASVIKTNLKIESLEARIAQLELNAPSMTRTSLWVDRGVLFVVGAMAMFIMKNVGLIGT